LRNGGKRRRSSNPDGGVSPVGISGGSWRRGEERKRALFFAEEEIGRLLAGSG
jgi:hypothetical protein